MTTQSIAEWRGQQLLDSDGEKIGTIDEIYIDSRTEQPEWALVKTGLFGGKGTFVPLQQASPEADGVRVPFDKEHVKDAPNVEPDGELSHSEERTLYEHYGVDYGASDSGSANGGENAVGRDTSGPTTDDAMTRSEEELRVGTERREAGRARLRKYVVTEEETHTVPVTKEKVRVEREPITDENVGRAMEGPDISDEEHEVILHEERPVVGKETVPKERVRLDTESVTEDQRVTEQVRKERIEAEGDGRQRRR